MCRTLLKTLFIDTFLIGVIQGIAGAIQSFCEEHKEDIEKLTSQEEEN